MQHAYTEIVIRKTLGSTRRIGSPGLGTGWQQAAVCGGWSLSFGGQRRVTQRQAAFGSA